MKYCPTCRQPIVDATGLSVDPVRGVVYVDGEARPVRHQAARVLDLLVKKSPDPATVDDLSRYAGGHSGMTYSHVTTIIYRIREKLRGTPYVVRLAPPKAYYLAVVDQTVISSPRDEQS